MFVTPRSKPTASDERKYAFPKRLRLLKSSDFRRVYQEGIRVSGPLFRAFCLARPEVAGPRVGFTVPRALGKAVTRNGIKRRMREAIRLEIGELAPCWDVVINPRVKVLDVPFDNLRREVNRVFRRCNAS